MNFFKCFKTSKSRIIFPIISVAASVISVVVIGGVSAIGGKIIEGEINSLGLGGLMISSKTQTALDVNCLEKIETSSAISKASPMVYSFSKVENLSGADDCILWGVDGAAGDVMHIKTLLGREINNADVRSFNSVCIVDSTYAKQRFGRENVIGKKLNILINGNYEQFEIVGVADGKSSIIKSAVSDYVPCFIYLPYTAMNIGTGDVFFTGIAVNLKDGVSISSAQKDILSRLESAEDYKIENLMTYSDTIEKILDMITLILSSIAGVSLVISGISVMTVMLFSVGERTCEIGIKKSVGASFFDILFEFLLEAVAICVFGGIIGVAAGIGATFIGCSILNIEAVLDYKIILVCLAVTSAFGIVFGIYPAIRAARLSPCEALRRN